ncbi:proline dehydrogenase, putative [Ichthyophthirius multifiliis]|uniref:Proline dehydrogenase n=1 Tax=Ichthyophthirius multifiliis TaxID=5932 RepID=G0QSH9_ICHMU|nr:proline dehydrogenase, putative [Ichthyophthirius multifiliis]EGR31817.1 proline dehydrogenase, putative [Ichthyophthirius multifiliis]|eukprot:XP_004035303.1 proline dehydrogenase, putative [Ichthyophthirius multifiliis]
MNNQPIKLQKRFIHNLTRFSFTSIQLNDQQEQQLNYYKSLRIYKEKSHLELFNLFFVNKLLHSPFFVNNSMYAYKFSSQIFGFKLTEFIIKNTMGRIFTGGANIQDVIKCQQNLSKRSIHKINIFYFKFQIGVPVIYDYCCEALDEDQNEFFMDKSAKCFEQTAKIGDSTQNNKISMKISAVCNMEILKTLNKVSEKQQELFNIIDQQKKATLLENRYFTQLIQIYNIYKQLFNQLINDGYNIEEADVIQFIKQILQIQLINDNYEETQIKKLDWLIYVHPYYIQQEKNQNNIVKQMQKLQNQQINQSENFIRRMNQVLDTASKNKTRVLIDAEQTYIQQSIDSFIQQFQLKYNKEIPIVYNTIQNYLKSSKYRIIFEVEKCNYLKIPFGIKMVRGAYMNEESRIAKKKGIENPICDSFDKTSEMINSNLKFLIDNISGNSEIIVGSHNCQTVQMVTDYLQQKNIKNTKQVYFAQLLGLSDNLTYQLVEKGYIVYKYVPFGETHIMIPYLIRRAQEQLQVLSSVELQYNLIKDEFKKRNLINT